MNDMRDLAATAVVARRLRKVYRGASVVEALRGIDLEVARGEMLAIVGPSGSGKTTLLNCLAGLDRFNGGEVLIDGREICSMTERERTAYRARNMGFVFQAFNLLPVLTAVESVEIPLLLLTLQLTFPLITSLGFDPIWFGVLSMMMVAMGLVFPPVGLIAFVVSATAGVDLMKVYKGTSVLMLAIVITTVLLMIFPQIALWLPQTMR